MTRKGSLRLGERSDDAMGDAPIGLLIRQLHLRLRAAASAALPRGEQGLPHLGVLAAIDDSPGISGAALARRYSVSPPTIAEIVAGLEGAGLIERLPDPKGGRALGAHLTPAGAAALRSGQKRLLEVEAHMLRRLSGADRDALRDLLKRCIESLYEAPEA